MTKPIDFYNENLPIVQRQKEFLNHLEKAIEKLVPLSANYKPTSVDTRNVLKEIKSKHSSENLTVDSSWSSFEIKSKSDFINKLFVSKNCHSKVPDQIVKELEFSEHIQSHSYYFYPMYGDAFSRQTRVFEMAIKARSKELNINIENRSLKRLIDEISKGYSKDFWFNLDWGRNMRNINAHPEMTTMYGSILKLPLLRMTNLINDIFRDPLFFEKEIEKIKIIKRKFENYKKGLWKFDRFLIQSIELIAVRNNYAMWAFHPVYDKYPQSRDKLFNQRPFFVYLKSFEGVNGNFFGTNIDDISIKIEKTSKKENISIASEYNKQYESSSDDIKQSMNISLEQNIFYALEEFKHTVNCL